MFVFPETHRYALAAAAFGGLAALALAGVCWALVMRLSVSFPEHYFEALFYVGASLATFSIALAYVRKRWGGAPAAAVAVLAAFVFAASAFQIGRLHREPGQAEFHKAMMADFDRIREIARGESVSIDPAFRMQTMMGAAPFRLHWVYYYLSGSPTATYAGDTSARLRTDFLVIMHKEDGGGISTLTPDNERAFLYSGVSGEAVYAAQYAALSSEDPAARSEFDLYLRDNTLSYLKDRSPKPMLF